MPSIPFCGLYVLLRINELRRSRLIWCCSVYCRGSLAGSLGKVLRTFWFVVPKLDVYPDAWRLILLDLVVLVGRIVA